MKTATRVKENKKQKKKGKCRTCQETGNMTKRRKKGSEIRMKEKSSDTGKRRT